MVRRFSRGFHRDPALELKCGVTSGNQCESIGQLHCGICQPGIFQPGNRTIKKDIDNRSV